MLIFMITPTANIMEEEKRLLTLFPPPQAFVDMGIGHELDKSGVNANGMK